MPLPDRLRLRLRALLGRRALDRELDDELRFHLEMETEQNVRLGLPPAAARARALREFGAVARVRDEARDARGVRGWEDVLRDARLAGRALRRTPAFTAVALLTLALGIGASTAVYTAVRAVLLRPLPFPAAERLLAVQERNAAGAAVRVAGANARDLQRESRTLEAVAYYSAFPATVLGADLPLRTPVAAVSREFFDVLGATPALGRAVAADEGGAGGPHVAVVSHRFWRTALGGDPDLARRTLTLFTETFQVVGVLPPAFDFPAGTDVWATVHDDNPHRTAHNWSVVARRAPDATEAQVRAELAALFARLKARHGEDTDAEDAVVTPLQTALAGDARRPLLVLLGAVGLVLLVTCVNLATANLARGEARQRELAVRTALGAGRGRLVRQLVVENVLLAGAGGALGVLLALALTRAIARAGTAALPDFADLRVDGGVLVFALALSLATGVLVGLLPALRVTRALAPTLAQGGRAGIGGAARAGRLRGRGVLVAAEVGLALVLLVGAGLLGRSLAALLDEDPGFRAGRVLTATLALPVTHYRSTVPGSSYGDTLAVARVLDALLASLRAAPGVTDAALISQVPFGGGGHSSSFMVDGAERGSGDADYRVVDEHYFATLGVPLLRGRGVLAADRPGAPPVVVVNRALAERHWPGADPIGHRLRLPGMDDHPDVWMTIVGVVGDVRHDGLDRPAAPALFIPFRQRPERLINGATVLVRATLPPARLAAVVRDHVRRADPNVPVELGTLDALVASSVAPRRLATTLLAAFAGLALLLAALGVYGVLSYAVAQRQRELGVRMALGAPRASVRAMVLRDAMRAVLPGVAAGVLGALALTRVLRGMLYGVAETDPLTFAATALLLVAVAAVAGYLPARRATRVDPAMAMRGDA